MLYITLLDFFMRIHCRKYNIKRITFHKLMVIETISSSNVGHLRTNIVTVNRHHFVYGEHFNVGFATLYEYMYS